MTSEEIKQRRLVLGLTQAELGEKLGVTGLTVSYWETGRRTPEASEMLSMAMSWLEYQQPKSERHKELIQQLNQSIAESRTRINADASRQRVRSKNSEVVADEI